MSIEDELALMLEMGDGGGESDEADVTPGTGEVVKEPSAPEGDATAGDAEAKKEDKTNEILTGLMEQNKLLLARLEALEGNGGSEGEESGGSSPSEKPKDESVVIVQQEDFEKIMNGDIEAFNRALAKAAKHGFEQAMLAVPEAVQKRVMTAVDSQTAVKTFFKENDDLVEHRQFVGFMAKQILEEDGSFANKPKELIEEAGKRLRKKFNLVKAGEPAKVEQSEKKAPISDVSGKGKQPVKESVKKPTTIEEQIALQFE